MPEAADQQQPEPEHPLHEILTDLRTRMQRLGEAKGYTAEHAKHEFRDDVYPILHDLAAFVGELDDRLAILEEEGGGISPDLAEAVAEGFTRSGACLDLFAKYVPAESDDGRALAEHRAWFAENVPGILEDVRAAVEGSDEEEEPEGVPQG